jgi:hypothetical protein
MREKEESGDASVKHGVSQRKQGEKNRRAG